MSLPSFQMAIRNVALWGDTDILPFPLENHWFHDDEDTVVSLLRALDRDFGTWLSDYPPVFDRVLAGVGYMGFRGGSQIDPIWNAYLLSLLIEIGPEIERARLPVSASQVFAYRFSPDPNTYSLFERQVNWKSFQEHALSRSQTKRYVLSADIADFYPRVYHHRIENALAGSSPNKEAVKRIKAILSRLSVGGVSYGLPIGGNAARLIAELLLNRTDRLLTTKGIDFCRFVDDYYIFSDSEEDARNALVYLSEVLLTHEGLTLQRSKTRLMNSEEFRRTSPIRSPNDADSAQEAEAQGFLNIRLLYDPYSPTADEDYEKLRDELSSVDVLGMLSRELKKTRIDETLVRQLVKAIRFLAHELRDAAVETLLGLKPRDPRDVRDAKEEISPNLEILYPVLPTVILVVKGLLRELSPRLQGRIMNLLRERVQRGAFLFRVPANLAFVLRLLVEDPAGEADQLFADLYDRPGSSMMLKRDLILCMARRRVEHWIADVSRRSSTLTPWEKRALIPASYVLGDEGTHWRKRTRAQLHQVDLAFTSWVEGKNVGRPWEIPL